MFKRITVGLVMIFCVAVIFACGQTSTKEPEEKNEAFQDAKDEVFKGAEDVEEAILKSGDQEEVEAPAEEEIMEEDVTEEEMPEETPIEEEESTAEEGGDGGESFEELIAVVATTKGTFKLKFFPDTAPKHVDNFVKLSREGFYDGLSFHRYVAGFVIQGGDPEGTGSGGPGYTIPAEIDTKHKHIKGAVAAARQGDNVNPERRSSGSQWYVCLEATPHLDSAYTVFGQVIDGMDVVLKLRKGDVMEKITIREKQ